MKAGAIARLLPTMLPTITPRPRRRASATIARPFGETAALVELDVDDVEAADQRFDVRQRLDTFVGSDRDRAAESVEVGLAPARERLLDQLDPAGHEIRHQCRKARRREALVGIDAHPGVWPRLAHGAHALGVERQFHR